MSARALEQTVIRAWDNDAAVTAFEDAITHERLIGYNPKDTFVGALVWLLSRLDIPLSERRVFEAVPHAPTVLSIEDIRNTLWNLGTNTELVPVTRYTWQNSIDPHLVLDHAGHPFVRHSHDAMPLCPVTGEAGPDRRRSYAMLLVQRPLPQDPPSPWVARQLLSLRSDILRLLLVKALLVLVSLAIALGVVAVYEWVLPTNAYDTLVALGMGLVGILVVDLGVRRLKARVMGDITERAEYVLATSLVQRVLSMPLEKVVTATPSQQRARLRQLMSAASTFSGPALDVVLDLPLAALLLAGLAYMALPLALVPFGLAILLIAIGSLALPELRRRETAANAARAAATQLLDEVVQDRGQIQADGREDVVFARGVKAAGAAAAAVQRHESLQRLIESASAAAGPLAGGMLAVLGALMVMRGEIGMGVLLATVILSWRILAPIQSASQLVLRLADMGQSRRAINAMMQIEPEYDPIISPLEGINGRSIAVDGLVCRYPGSSEAALKGVSVEIPQGALVAVTGPSGAGKTALLRAISGLVPAQGGRVVVGGLNALQVPVSTLRRSVAFVPARPHILHGTIAQNLRLGNPGADERTLRLVCDDLGILSIIEALPEGFQTRITTQRASGLPSGFVQSLSIARAIMEAPDALLLDEPAVGLDEALETGLLKTLEKGRGVHTVLMVTHRPSHVRFCDLELRLERGLLRRFDRPKGKAA